MNSRPDFIITGGWWGDRVVMWASREVSEVVMNTEYEFERSRYDHLFDSRWPIDERTDIKASIRGYVEVNGSDYREAWANLFNIWTPPQVARKEIGGHTLELDS